MRSLGQGDLEDVTEGAGLHVDEIDAAGDFAAGVACAVPDKLVRAGGHLLVDKCSDDLPGETVDDDSDNARLGQVILQRGLRVERVWTSRPEGICPGAALRSRGVSGALEFAARFAGSFANQVLSCQYSLGECVEVPPESCDFRFQFV